MLNWALMFDDKKLLAFFKHVKGLTLWRVEGESEFFIGKITNVGLGDMHEVKLKWHGFIELDWNCMTRLQLSVGGTQQLKVGSARGEADNEVASLPGGTASRWRVGFVMVFSVNRLAPTKWRPTPRPDPKKRADGSPRCWGRLSWSSATRSRKTRTLGLAEKEAGETAPGHGPGRPAILAEARRQETGGTG